MSIHDSQHEQADQLAREGGQLDQGDRYISYTDEQTIIKTLSKKKWKQQHHNRLNAHMYNKFKDGESELCPCNPDIMTAEHLLQHCQTTGCFEAGHVAWTDTTEGQALWQPGGVEEDSRLHGGNRHFHLAYDEEEDSQHIIHTCAY